MKSYTAPAAAAVFGINAVLCWPLFGVEHLNDLQSNEGSFISIGRFLAGNWPHVAWFPWFNGGTPLESAYLPLVPALVALISALTRWTPGHAFHFLAALIYSLGPVFVFLFCRKVSGRLAPSLAAALAWPLFSPALALPQFRAEEGTLWGLHRLRTIVFYGETPHNFALSLLPLSLASSGPLPGRLLGQGASPRRRGCRGNHAELMPSAFPWSSSPCSSFGSPSTARTGGGFLLRVAAVPLIAYLLGICAFLEPLSAA